MRIIGGELKGRVLKAPRGWTTRPTSDKVREAVFNVLGQEVDGGMFLDLFAGSGAVGIEALSRGSQRATFVENSREAIKIIERNLTSTGLSGLAQILPMDVRRALAVLEREGIRFSVCFLDPPYDVGVGEDLIVEILARGLLETGGWLVVEVSHRHQAQISDKIMPLKKRKRYGDTIVQFYQHAH